MSNIIVCIPLESLSSLKDLGFTDYWAENFVYGHGKGNLQEFLKKALVEMAYDGHGNVIIDVKVKVKTRPSCFVKEKRIEDLKMFAEMI